MRTQLLATTCILMMSASAAAADIFVDNLLGDDRRTASIAVVTGEGGGPCRTIAKALRIALPGDRIVIAKTGQPYRESITIQGPNHSGDERHPLTIIGNGATLDGTLSLAGYQWEYVGGNTFRTRPPHMSFQQLFLDDQPVKRKQQPPDGFPKLGPREWCLLAGWIYFGVDQGKLPDAYNLSCCGEQVGITLYEVHDVVIEDLNVRGFWLDGVNCHDNVRRTDIVRVTAKENGRSGISVGGSSRVRIDTCTASGNGAAQLRIEGYSIVQMLDNTLDGISAPAVVREGGKIVAGD
jgi:Right handed beta helix region